MLNVSPGKAIMRLKNEPFFIAVSFSVKGVFICTTSFFVSADDKKLIGLISTNEFGFKVPDIERESTRAMSMIKNLQHKKTKTPASTDTASVLVICCFCLAIIRCLLFCLFFF